MIRYGKDYAYFKIGYFDFPLNDSLVKVIGNIVFTCTITTHW